MNEKVKAFYEVVSADGKLQEELVVVTEGVDLDGIPEEDARQAMADAVAAFAAEHDLDLTAADILAADAEAEGELSEQELETVAGGGLGCLCMFIGAVKGCGCFIWAVSRPTIPASPICCTASAPSWWAPSKGASQEDAGPT